jgi:hypothetical protein
LRLAYHDYLIFAGAAICNWTQVYFWHGQEIIWLVGAILALAGNVVSQACRYAIIMERKRSDHAKRHREKESWFIRALLAAASFYNH